MKDKQGVLSLITNRLSKYKILIKELFKLLIKKIEKQR